MAADLSHFLLPTCRLRTDVTFVVSGKEVGAHKSFLVAADPAFEEIFWGDEAGAEVSNVEVSTSLMIMIISYKYSFEGEGWSK